MLEYIRPRAAPNSKSLRNTQLWPRRSCLAIIFSCRPASFQFLTWRQARRNLATRKCERQNSPNWRALLAITLETASFCWCLLSWYALESCTFSTTYSRPTTLHSCFAMGRDRFILHPQFRRRTLFRAESVRCCISSEQFVHTCRIERSRKMFWTAHLVDPRSYQTWQLFAEGFLVNLLIAPL